jgi:hypothetical protein
MAVVIHKKFSSPMVFAGIPLSIIGVLAVFFYERLHATVDTQRGSVWLDNFFSDAITVFTQGFHFTPMWYGEEKDKEKDFLRHVPILGKAVEFSSVDGYTLIADFTVLFQNICEKSALGHRLKYADEDLKLLVLATVKSYLTDIGGLNSYEVLNARKGEVASWLANIFGGEGVRSPFEVQIGGRLKNPVLETYNLDAKSKELWLKRALGNVVTEITRNQFDITKDSAESSKAAQAVAGVMERKDTRVHVVVDGKDLKPGVTTLVIGNAGMAVGGK